MNKIFIFGILFIKIKCLEWSVFVPFYLKKLILDILYLFKNYLRFKNQTNHLFLKEM